LLEKITKDYDPTYAFDSNLLYQKDDSNYDSNAYHHRSGKSLSNLNQNEFNYDQLNQ